MNQTKRVNEKRFQLKVLSFLMVLCLAATVTVCDFGITAKAEVAAVNSYNACTAVAAQEAKDVGSKFDDEVWSYEERSAPAQTVTVDGASKKVYLPTGDWSNIDIWRQSSWQSSAAGVRSALPKMLFVWNSVGAEGRGLATYNNRVITFVGTKCPVTPTLTFTAPQTGSVRLYDKEKTGVVGAASTGSPFYTLNDSTKTVGFAIYKNNEKIWPIDQDYYTLSSNKTSVAFPDIGNVNVTKGDKIRFSFIPLTQSWGYMTFAPQVDYLSVNSFVSSYNGTTAVAQQEKQPQNSQFRDPVWSYEEKSAPKQTITVDGVSKEVYLPTGDWATTNIWNGAWCSSADGVRTDLPSMFFVWNNSVGSEGRGLASKNNKVVTFVGNKCPVAPTYTFKAPLDGTIRLHDPDNGVIGPASLGYPYWTLNDAGESVGVAIYKNNEKIWPAETDYYTLDDQNYSVNFPDLNDISVVKGDKIRIMFIPLTNNWGYMSFNPQVDYQSVNESGWDSKPIRVDVDTVPANLRYFEVEAYDFSDLTASIRYADGTTRSLSESATDVTAKYVLNAPRTIGTNSITLSYDDGTYQYTGSFNATVLAMLYGDVNADSSVDVNDLTSIRKYLIGADSNIHTCVAKVSGNNDISIKDIVRLKKYLADSTVHLGPAE